MPHWWLQPRQDWFDTQLRHALWMVAAALRQDDLQTLIFSESLNITLVSKIIQSFCIFHHIIVFKKRVNVAEISI